MALFNFRKKQEETLPQPIVNKTPTVNVTQSFNRWVDDNGMSLSNYDLNKTSRGYLDGPDNLYPQFLNNLYSFSPIHSNILNLKTRLSVGNGYELYNTEGLQMSQKIILNQFINQFEGCFEEVALDYFIHNKIAILVTWNSDNSKIIKFKRLSPSTIRIAEIDNMYEPTSFYYNYNWIVYTRHQTIKYPKFDQANKTDKQQLLFVQFDSPSKLLYSRPTYLSAIKAILTDSESSTLQLSYLKNAAVPSIVITHPYELDAEEQAAFVAQMDENFGDTHNAGKILNLFSKNKETEINVHQLDPINVSSGFIDLMDQTTRKICLGNGVDPEIIGLKAAGQLGNADFVYQWNQFNQGQIQPAQRKIEMVFNEILTYYNLPVQLEFNDPNIEHSAIQKVAEDKTQVEAMSEDVTNEPQINTILKSVSGREHQHFLRIIRQFESGKISPETAKLLLASGFGLSEEQITQILNIK